MAASKSKFGSCLLFVILGFVGFVVLVSTSKRAPDPVSTPVTTVPAPLQKEQTGLLVGDDCILGKIGGGSVCFASTDDAFNEMLDAQNAGREALLLRLVNQGKVNVVEGGTRGVVVKTAFASLFVQVVEGQFKGDEGWVQRELVSKPAKETAVVPDVEHDLVPRNAPKGATPPNRASSALNIARNLEKSGKTSAAIKAYREVLKNFPETPEAESAQERIKLLATP